MLIKLFLIFTIIPIIEVYLLIKIGGLIGALPTTLLLLSISLFGAWLVRHQGFSILRRVTMEMGQGRLPAGELVDGVLVLIGGALLLTPGFFTDILGLLFILPFTRPLIKRLAVTWLQRKVSQGTVTVVKL